jgi:MarR family transcriptional regulator, organic hydroperoxide resistance regulator
MKFSESEVFKLHEIVIRLDAYAQGVLLAPIGLTYAEFLVLMAVRESRSSTHQDISGAIGASKSLVSQRVKSLEGKRMARQVVNAKNRREHFVELTPKGSETLDRAYASLLGASEEVFGPLGKDRDRLNLLLDRLLEAMGKIEAARRTREARR